MSAAHRTDRSGGRKVVDSLIDAVAAPLSFFDQSNAYTRHLERALLAEGRRRLIECMQAALDADIHEHHRAANRALVSAFGRMEADYRYWLHDILTAAADTLPSPREQRRGYRSRAHRFVTTYQQFSELEVQQVAVVARQSDAVPFLFAVTECLDALIDLSEFLWRKLDDARDTEATRALDLLSVAIAHHQLARWYHALVDTRGLHQRLAKDDEKPFADYGTSALVDGKVSEVIKAHLREGPVRARQIEMWRTVAGAVDAVVERTGDGFDAPASTGEGIGRRASSWLKTVTERLDSSLSVTQDALLRVGRLLLPHRRWGGDALIGTARRAPAEMAQILRIRELATQTFRSLDEHDETAAWGRGRLGEIERAAIEHVFREVIERSPEPVPFDALVQIVDKHLDRGSELRLEGNRVFVRHHLQTLLAGFTHIIERFEHEYRHDLAVRVDDAADDEIRRGPRRSSALDFGWSRLAPAIWSDDSLELWTEREERDGGVSLPVTYRLVFNRAPDAHAQLDSVMLVPLFPVQRTLEGAPLRQLIDYMHSGVVAILHRETQVSRLPYRLAALSSHLVDGARVVARLVWLGTHLLVHRLGSKDAPHEDKGRELWAKGIASFVRLGSQRNSPLDRTRRRLLRWALPRVGRLTGVAEVPRVRIDLALTPVPFLVWCDAVRLVGKLWRDDLSEKNLLPGDSGARPALEPPSPMVEVLRLALDRRHPAGRRQAIDNCVEILSTAWALIARLHPEPISSTGTKRVLGTDHLDGAARRASRGLIEKLELFLLAMLYHRTSRRDRDVPVPRRLEDWVDHVDVFAMVARARPTAHRGRRVRGQVLSTLMLTPLSTARRLPDVESAPAQQAGTSRPVSTLDEADVGDYRRALERCLSELMSGTSRRLERRSARPDDEAVNGAPTPESDPAPRLPTVETLLSEALRRSSPSTYVTLRDVFWDYVAWPLPVTDHERQPMTPSDPNGETR